MMLRTVEDMDSTIKSHESTLAWLKEQREWVLKVLALAPHLGLPERGASISLAPLHGTAPSVKWTAMRWQRLKGHAVCGNGQGHVTLILRGGETHWHWRNYHEEEAHRGMDIPPGVLDYIQSKADLFGDLGETRDA